MKLRSLILLLYLVLTHSTYAQTDSTANDSQPAITEPNLEQPLNNAASSSAAQPGEPTQAPASDVFSLQGDQVGLFQNGVNLFTGEVAFSLPLVSLPGRNGLNAGVSLSYNSAGTKQAVETWNLEAPTSAIGLGWSMDLPKIVVDHKQTGTREDDDFFLVEGGVSNKLVLTGRNSTTRYYQLQNYQPWKISYQESKERWEITKEDGTKYYYGENYNGRSSVQYLVRWGNWIGDSNRGSGQRQQAMQWDLAAIDNLYGDKVIFTYQQQLRKVGTGSNAKQHTEASYIREIKTSLGYKAIFHRGAKTSGSNKGYQEPHTEKSEPDAYQERYERELYRRLEVFAPSGKLLYKIHLNNTSGTGTGSFYKAQLKSIQKENQLGEKLPDIQFTYYTVKNRKGSIRQVTTPQGATVNYSYNDNGLTIEHSKQDLTINAPSGYAEPRTWIGSNYVVVAWRRLVNNTSNAHTRDLRPVKLKVYSWQGRWVENPEEFSFANVGISCDNCLDRTYKDFEVRLGKDFFTVLQRPGGSSTWNVSIVYQNAAKPGQWSKMPSTISSGQNPSSMVGDKFVAIGFEGSNSNVYTWLWDGNIWQRKTLSLGLGDTQFTSGHNYLIAHDNSTNPDRIHFYYLDETHQWKSGTVPSNVLIDTGYDKKDDGKGGKNSFWYGSNSFAVCMADKYPEFIYMWDVNYQLRRVDGKLGGWADTDPVFITNNSFIGLEGINVAAGFRYDGGTWWASGRQTLTRLGSSFGHDFFIRNRASGQAQLRQFNPNTNQWTAYNFAGTSEQFLLSAGLDYAFYGDDYYYRKPSGSWYNKVYTIPSSWPFTGAHYQAGGYRLNAITSGNNTLVMQTHNGDVNPLPQLNNKEITRGFNQVVRASQLINSDIVVTFPSAYSKMEDARSLTLHKLVEKELTNKQKAYPLTRITVSDGFRQTHTSYEYTGATATMSANGSTAQFNKVVTVPGSANTQKRPFGYTINYFFNGLPSNNLSASIPSTYPGNANREYGRLVGLPYLVQSYSASHQKVAQQKTIWQVFGQNINYSSRKVDRARHARTVRAENEVDGVKTITETYYNSYGQVDYTIAQNHDDEGNLDYYTTSYLYAYQKYGALNHSGKNILTPVIQTKTKVNNTSNTNVKTLSMSATTWKDWGSGRWAPSTSYEWNGQGSASDFPFSNPTSSATVNWRRLSGVKARDSKNNVTESEDIDGMRHVTIWGHDQSLPITQVSNASRNEVLCDNFDDGSITDTNPVSEGWYRSNNNIKVDRYGHLSLPTGGANIITSKKAMPSQYFVADFSMRVPAGGSVPWVGFEFSKKAANHCGNCTTNSGYVLYVRQNGQVALEASQGGTIASGVTLSTNPVDSRNEWHEYRVVKQGNRIQVYIDGLRRYDVKHTLPASKQGGYLGFANNQARGEIDNLRVYPSDAYAKMTSYDPDFRYAKAVYGNEGLETNALYDANQQNVASAGVKGNLLSSQASYLYRKFNSGNFSANDPNSMHQATPQGVQSWYDDFERSRTDHPLGSLISSWTVLEGRLRHSSIGEVAAGHTINWGREFQGRVVVELDVHTGLINSNSATQRTFGFTVGGSSLTQGASGGEVAVQTIFQGHQNWQYYQSGWKQLRDNLKANTVYRFKIVLNTGNQEADFYVDGRLQRRRVPFKQSTSGIQKLSFYNQGGGNSTTWFIDNIVVYTDPIQNTTYLDATGKLRQTQAQESDNQILVSQTLYDNLGRAEATTKTTRINTSSGFSHRNGFTEYTLPSNKQLGGSLHYYNQADSKYAYYRTKFEASPLGRSIGQGMPGTALRIGSGHTNRTNYYNNSTQGMGQTVGGKNYPGSAYSVIKSTDADGHSSWVMTDKMGNVIREKAQKSSSKTVQTAYRYDQYGRVSKIYHPNYFNTPSGRSASAFVTTMNYDHFGQMTSQTTTDAGTTRYIYDKAGRLRFMQDARGSAENYILYWIYDKWGRVTEEGYSNQSWSRSNLQAKANNRSWPTSNKVWRKKNTYGNHEERSSYRGRLILSSINNDAEVVERWRYDAHGNVFNHETKVTDFDNQTHLVSYVNNHLGQRLAVFHPHVRIVYEYDWLGRMVSVGDEKKRDYDYFASYTYDVNGRLKQEKINNQTLTQNFSYSSPGWLKQISSSKFVETLQYTYGGYNSNGYYSGLIAKTSFDFKGHHTNYSYNYQYDRLGQLQVANHSGNNKHDIGVGAAIHYDANGNITRMRRGSKTYYYQYYVGNRSGTNRLKTTRGNGDLEYKYDANGNIIQDEYQRITYDRFFNLPTSIRQSIPNGSPSGSPSATASTNAMVSASPPAPGSPRVTENNDIQYGASGQQVYERRYQSVNTSSTSKQLYIYGADSRPLVRKTYIGAGPFTGTSNQTKTEYYIYGSNGLIAIQKPPTVFSSASFSATMEPARAQEEQSAFDLQDGQPIASELFNHTPDSLGNAAYSLRLIGRADSAATGLATALPVSPGDTVNVSVYAKYPAPKTKAQLSALAAQLSGVATGAQVNPVSEAGSSVLTESPLTALLALPTDDNEKSSVPQAYLNYLVFDTAGVVLDQGFQPISAAAGEDGSNTPHEQLQLETVIEQPGYVYAYVSNETPGSEVFFDDMVMNSSTPSTQLYFMLKDHLGSTRMVLNEQNNVTEAYDYDAWGKMIYSTANKPTEQRYTGQRQVNSQVYHYGARLYNPTVGIFYGVDPAKQFHSPYTAMGNNPVSMVDPDGEFVVPALIGAAISVVTNGVGNLASGESFFKGAGVAALTGAIGGAASFGIGQAASQIGSNVGRVAFQTAAHGLLGGSMSMATGGEFGSGFLAGSLGSLAGTATSGLTQGMQSGFAKGAITIGSGALSGGIGSRIGGGSFWDGARNGAISAGLNHGIHSGAFGKGLMMAAITGRTRHLLGPDADQMSLTGGASIGGSVAGQMSLLRILRGKEAGIYNLMDASLGIVTDIGISGGVESSDYYYTGPVSSLKASTFAGVRGELSVSFAALPFISAGVAASFASVDKGANRLYSIGTTSSIGLSAFDALPVPATFGGNWGYSTVRPLR